MKQTHSCVSDGLVAVHAHEGNEAEPVGDVLVWEDAGVRDELDEVDGLKSMEQRWFEKGGATNRRWGGRPS